MAEVILATVVIAILWLGVLKGRELAAGEKNQPYRLVFFLVSGLLSVPLALFFYGVLDFVTNPLFIGDYNSVLSFLDNFLVVGPVEELAKFLIFLGTALLLKSCKDPTDGIIHGASVALAFSLVENLLYHSWYYDLSLFFFRSLVCCLGHMVYAAFWGATAGEVLYRLNSRPGYRVTRDDIKVVVLSWLAAAWLHGFYNLMVYLTWGNLLAALFLDGLSLFLAWKLLQFNRRRSPYTLLAQKREASSPEPESSEIRILEEGLHANPANYSLRSELGKALLQKGEIEKALVQFRKNTAAHPKKRRSLLRAALCAAVVGKETQASEAFHQVLDQERRRTFELWLADDLEFFPRRVQQEKIRSLLRKIEKERKKAYRKRLGLEN